MLHQTAAHRPDAPTSTTPCPPRGPVRGHQTNCPHVISVRWAENIYMGLILWHKTLSAGKFWL